MLNNENHNGRAESAAKPAGMTNGASNGAPSPEEVRSQLRRILDSADFPASERNRRFLAHVVECSLEGGKANGYGVATKIFGRPETFNPSEDPIVRIEAGKLRRDLETYYLKSGKDDPLHIEIPKGSYRAVFARNGTSHDGNAGILLAALFGLAGRTAEAAAAWRSLPHPLPAIAADGHVLDRISGTALRAETVRGLLFDGLSNAKKHAAAMPSEVLPSSRCV